MTTNTKELERFIKQIVPKNPALVNPRYSTIKFYILFSFHIFDYYWSAILLSPFNDFFLTQKTPFVTVYLRKANQMSVCVNSDQK